MMVHFFQGTDATLADGFAPLSPPLLPCQGPWENRMGRGQTDKQNMDMATTRPKWPKGRFCENILGTSA